MDVGLFPTGRLCRPLALILLCLATGFFGIRPAEAQVTRAEELVYPPLPEVEMPVPQRVVLDNGMVVMLLEDPELPIIQARALIRTGSRWESPELTGLAALTGQLLRSGGTEELSSDALDDLLEDRAAVLETSIGLTSGAAYLSCLREDFPEMLQIFSDVLRRPAFEAEKLVVAKTLAEANIARQNDSASQILNREFRELLYGEGSPYVRPTTYASLAAIDRSDLLAWHETYFHPNRVVLGITGDFESTETLALVRKVFGDWKKGPKVDDEIPSVDLTPRPGIYFIEKEGITQSNIRIGHLGLRRDHPDYYALEVMNQVFGGSFAARLFSRVRTEKGLAYNVFGVLTTGWDYPGLFLMSMSTKTETTAAGIDALLLEARNLTAEPPTAEEVAQAKESILNSFVFRADSLDEILDQQLTFEYYGYPADWLERYRKGIEGVRLEQVRDAAARHVHLDDLSILVVGPREGTDRPLSDFGEVREIDISIPEPAAARSGG